MYLKSDGHPDIKEGDIVYTREFRMLFEKGSCGESITQKTRYKIVHHPDYASLMAKCLDYDRKLVKPTDLKSVGLSWTRLGYRKEVSNE